MSGTQWQAESFMQKPSSSPVRWAILLFFAAIVLFFVVASYYEIDRTILVEGEVTSLQGVKDVFTVQDGTLLEVNQSVGAEVKAGQVIAELKMPFSNTTQVSGQLAKLRAFYDEEARASKLVAGKFPDVRSESPVITKSISEAKETWQKYESVLHESEVILSQQIKTVDSKIGTAKKKIGLLKLSSQHKLMGALIDELSEKLDDLAQERMTALEDSKAKKLLAKSQALAQLKNSYLLIYDFYESHMIRAPAAGIIAAKNISSNQQVVKGQKLFSIMPQPAEFAVKLNVSSSRIGKVQLESAVRIAVDSYPYQQYGHFTGHVYSIDQVISPSESYFAVQTTIGKPEIARRPSAELTLLPGMKVKAYIFAKRQTLLQTMYQRVFLNEER